MNVRLGILAIALLCVLAQCHGVGLIKAGQQTKRKTKVEANYDEGKKETTARIGPYQLWKPPQNSVSGETNFESVDLLLAFSYPGKKVIKPKSVTLLVFSVTQRDEGFESQAKGEFERSRELSVSTESKRYNFGEVEVMGMGKGRAATRVSQPTNVVLVREVVKKDIPFEDFSQIAHSEKAEMKVGERKFKLKKEHLEAFRNFESLMEQEGLEF